MKPYRLLADKHLAAISHLLEQRLANFAKSWCPGEAVEILSLEPWCLSAGQPLPEAWSWGGVAADETDRWVALSIDSDSERQWLELLLQQELQQELQSRTSPLLELLLAECFNAMGHALAGTDSVSIGRGFNFNKLAPASLAAASGTVCAVIRLGSVQCRVLLPDRLLTLAYADMDAVQPPLTSVAFAQVARGMDVTLDVSLGTASMAADQLAAVKVGDIIPMDRGLDGLCRIRVDAQTLPVASLLGQGNGHKVIKIMGHSDLWGSEVKG